MSFLTRTTSRPVSRRSIRAGGAVALFVGALAILGAPACGADDPAGPAGASGSDGQAGSSTGTGGQAGSGGSSGQGPAGTGGVAGSAGKGGSAGASGAGANGGTAGSGGGAGAGGSSGNGGSAGAQPDAGRAGGDAGGGTAGRDAGSGSDASVAIDGATGNDAPLPDGGICVVPDPKDTTITAYQSDIVSRLAGQTEISAGVKLTNRATATNRQAVRDYMKTLFQDLGLTPVEQAYGTGTNVYATLAATTGAAATIVFGAHYDSVMVSPGANDNATGVAAVFAVARYAAKLTCRSKSLVFVLFDEEELGLLGSKQFAAKLKADGTQVHSVHTIDQMGWDSDGDRAIELELPDTGLKELYQAAVTELGVSVPLTPTTTSSTDHSSFRPTFLAIGLTEEYATRPSDTTPYYHKAGDTFDTVNFDYLLSTTVIVNQVVADITR